MQKFFETLAFQAKALLFHSLNIKKNLIALCNIFLKYRYVVKYKQIKYVFTAYFFICSRLIWILKLICTSLIFIKIFPLLTISK